MPCLRRPRFLSISSVAMCDLQFIHRNFISLCPSFRSIAPVTLLNGQRATHGHIIIFVYNICKFSDGWQRKKKIWIFHVSIYLNATRIILYLNHRAKCMQAQRYELIKTAKTKSDKFSLYSLKPYSIQKV